MRVRHLRTLKAPYLDNAGREIYEGNILAPAAGIYLFGQSVVFERGTWWLYDQMPFYLDQSNRYRKLTADNARNMRIVNDKVVLK